ncbi:MAG: hypothetical protein P8019_00810 [Gammaproteobacteria bacterium]|jgi:hypothetical protein
MSALIRLFWDICIFQRGPQDVPYSPFLLAILLVIKLSFEFATFLIPDAKGGTLPLGTVIPYLLVDAGASILFVYFILWIHGRAVRGVQTITTTLGIDIIIGLAQLPLQYLASSAGNQPNMLGLFYLGTMAVFVWELAIYTHVIRHALSTSIFRAGGYALLLFILGFVVNYQMIPVSG